MRFRHVLRRLARAPVFTIITALTLAVCIGANSAIFSVINGILLKPLTYPHPNELIELSHAAPGVNLPDAGSAPFLHVPRPGTIVPGRWAVPMDQPDRHGTRRAGNCAVPRCDRPSATDSRCAAGDRSAAALNHPNIVTLYSVEESNGMHFLTMELVDGQQLSELLPAGGFPSSRAVEVAAGMAEAVAAAHDKGVVHRDLKPANIMITRDGRVKGARLCSRQGTAIDRP